MTTIKNQPGMVTMATATGRLPQPSNHATEGYRILRILWGRRGKNAAGLMTSSTSSAPQDQTEQGHDDKEVLCLLLPTRDLP
jgi:hypothetical protein